MSAVTDAWQAALHAEQQAAFGYALLGPRLPVAQQDLARTCQATHESIRDRTAEAISAAGTTPAAPAGDYPALYPKASAPRALAAQLEDDCAAAWRYLYAQAAAAAARVDRHPHRRPGRADRERSACDALAKGHQPEPRRSGVSGL